MGKAVLFYPKSTAFPLSIHKSTEYQIVTKTPQNIAKFYYIYQSRNGSALKSLKAGPHRFFQMIHFARFHFSLKPSLLCSAVFQSQIQSKSGVFPPRWKIIC